MTCQDLHKFAALRYLLSPKCKYLFTTSVSFESFLVNGPKCSLVGCCNNLVEKTIFLLKVSY